VKVYISADMEGITGVTHQDECMKDHPSYAEFRDRMTSEVAAACEGAIEAGASEILIKDAHGTGRNIIAEKLPACARLIRGWSGHPLMQVAGLDDSFDAVLFVGYHAKAGSDANPLAHTFSGKMSRIELNGEIASEFLIHAYAAAWVGVPVVFLSGDEEICQEASLKIPNLKTVAVFQGEGLSTISIAPGVARQRIKDGVATALRADLRDYRIALAERFNLELTYRRPVEAYRDFWFPGMKRESPSALSFDATDYFEILRTLRFCT
jgi:D-amino peptidase